VFSLKRSTAGAFTAPFRVLRPKKYDKRYLIINFTSRIEAIVFIAIKNYDSVNVLFYNWYLVGLKNISSHDGHTRGGTS